MARTPTASFADLLKEAETAGIPTRTIDVAKELEAHSKGLGAKVLSVELKAAKKPVDHPDQFVAQFGTIATAFYESWRSIEAALTAYNTENKTALVIDHAALREGSATLISGSANPVAAMYAVSQRKLRAVAADARASEPVLAQTTPQDVAALAQYLTSVNKVEPTVFIHVGEKGPDRERYEGSLQADGAITADENGKDHGGKTYPDYRAWYNAVFAGSTGGSPARVVGVVLKGLGDTSLEKAVREARKAGHIATTAATEGSDGDGNGDGNKVTDESEIPVSAGPPASNGHARRR